MLDLALLIILVIRIFHRTEERVYPSACTYDWIYYLIYNCLYLL